MKVQLVNVAVETLKKIVAPAPADDCHACLDACQCADPDSCRYN